MLLAPFHMVFVVACESVGERERERERKVVHNFKEIKRGVGEGEGERGASGCLRITEQTSSFFSIICLFTHSHFSKKCERKKKAMPTSPFSHLSLSLSLTYICSHTLSLTYTHKLTHAHALAQRVFLNLVAV